MRFVAGLGRRSGRDTAGRGAVAERHREDVAGRGAAAKSHREDAAGQGCRSGRDTAGRGSVARGCAVAKMLLPGRSIGKTEKQHARTKSRI